MKPLRLSVIAAIAGTLMAQAGCNRGPEFGPPDSITKTGDNQTGVAGVALPETPRVIVLDADQRPVPGVQVSFAVSSGGGTVDSTSVLTDGSGIASPGAWKLGTTTGTNTLVASAAVPGSPVFFTATATAGPIAALTKVAASPVTAPAGANIDSVVVKASDQFGNPVAGVTIQFAVTAGGGAVSPTSVITGPDGRAATRWTMGVDADTPNTMLASAGPGMSVTFSTITTRGVGEIRIGQHVLVVDSTGTITPTVTTFDPNGAAVPGATFTLATRNTSVASAGATSVTGLRAGQTLLIASSVDNPLVRDSAVVIVANLEAPVVSMNFPRIDLKADTSFTVSLFIDMRSATTRLGAATLQVVWDPSVIQLLSEAAGSTSMATVVNASTASTGSLTVAVASPSGVTGVSELRRLTFKASSTAGKTGTMVVNVADISAAATFANLFAVTVSGSYPMRIR